MPRRTIRLSADADERLQSAVKLRGYANPSAFLRAAMDHELKGREETMLGAEERLATSMDQISREISPARASTASLVRVGGQSSEDFADLHSRAGWQRQWKPP